MLTKTRLETRIDVSDLRAQMIAHPLYSAIRTADDVRAFMRYHVFCVWDFQSLAKALQGKLTCVTLPWLPTPDAHARRLINEIVLDEESDEVGPEEYLSHFELYHAAMRECGADTGPIDRLLSNLRQGASLEAALAKAGVPAPVSNFVQRTLASARSNDVHSLCADFTLGREDVIPDMFRRMIESLSAQEPGRFSKFLFYLERHVLTDGERHGPLSKQLLERLCGEDAVKWKQAEETARAALQSRIELWDEILKGLPSGAKTAVKAGRL